MIRSISNPLPTAPSPSSSNIQDVCFPSTVNKPVWSTGAYLTFPAVLNGPSASQNWKLISMSISGYLVFTNGNGSPGGSPCFGKLSKVMAAIDPFHEYPSSQNQLGNGSPWNFPITTLPADQTLACTLWDFQTDPLPPSQFVQFGGATDLLSNLGQTLPVFGNITPPEPIELLPGVQPGIMVWIPPQLGGISGGTLPNYMGLTLMSSTYTIDFDDGN